MIQKKKKMTQPFKEVADDPHWHYKICLHWDAGHKAQLQFKRAVISKLRD